MLNKNNERELCYLVTIDSIEPIEGKDRVECARVGGWTIMVRKGQFKPGDLGIYFEIDSKVPETEPFDFLASKHYKIKTQRYKAGDGHFYSQGLLMHPSDFGWDVATEPVGGVRTDVVLDSNGKAHYVDDESRFLTEKLGVKYYVAEDNMRKAKKIDKYQRMNQRLGKKAARPLYKWLYKRDWGKVLLFAIYGSSKDNPKRFPKHFEYIKPTDQERCENMQWVLEDKTPYIVTQKCDGSSATYILERKHKLFGPKFEYYVCSRNVRQFDMGQECFYDENYYWMAEFKYHIRDFLKDYLNKHPKLEYVCVQGELCHPKIQKNPHGLKDLHFFAFHMIDSKQGKYDIRDAKKIWDEYNIESVPIVCDNFILPDDFEEFKLMADGFYDPSVCEGQTNKAREGFVYYKTSDPNFSFKNVSRVYLMKH